MVLVLCLIVFLIIYLKLNSDKPVTKLGELSQDLQQIEADYHCRSFPAVKLAGRQPRFAWLFKKELRSGRVQVEAFIVFEQVVWRAQKTLRDILRLKKLIAKKWLIFLCGLLGVQLAVFFQIPLSDELSLGEVCSSHVLSICVLAFYALAFKVLRPSCWFFQKSYSKRASLWVRALLFDRMSQHLPGYEELIRQQTLEKTFGICRRLDRIKLLGRQADQTILQDQQKISDFEALFPGMDFCAMSLFALSNTGYLVANLLLEQFV